MIIDTFILVNCWLHLSAAALLAGGMIFLVVILRPALKRSASKSGIGKFANDVHERFRIYVGILIGVLIVTGILNSMNSAMPFAESGLGSGYKAVIRVKVALAVCLFIIYGINAFLIKEEKTDEDCGCLIQPPVHKKILQVIALLLVFAIFFLAATLRLYR